MKGDLLLLTPTWGGDDGLSILSAEYASALHELSDGELTVWALTTGTTERQPLDRPIRVRSFAGRRSSVGRAALNTALAPQRHRAVITLHVNQLPVAAPLVVAGVPLVHVLVGVEAWTPLRGVRAAVLKRARRQLAISAHTFQRFQTANPTLAHQQTARVVHPHTPWLPAPNSPRAESSGYALIVGRMAAEERYKGHDALIDIWPAVCATVPNARLVCVGDGDDVERLRLRAQTAGLGAAVNFTGPVSVAELAVLYRDCAFFVLPSDREGFGFVFLEAMSAGRACIGAPGSAQEIIIADQTGFIVGSGDAASLQAHVTTLFRDVALRQRFGAAGCLRASRVFNRSTFVRQLGEALAPWL